MIIISIDRIIVFVLKFKHKHKAIKNIREKVFINLLNIV
jgi:hypothetical protein